MGNTLVSEETCVCVNHNPPPPPLFSLFLIQTVYSCGPKSYSGSFIISNDWSKIKHLLLPGGPHFIYRFFYFIRRRGPGAIFLRSRWIYFLFSWDILRGPKCPWVSVRTQRFMLWSCYYILQTLLWVLMESVLDFLFSSVWNKLSHSSFYIFFSLPMCSLFTLLRVCNKCICLA